MKPQQRISHVGRPTGVEGDLIVEDLFRGFTRCIEAESRLEQCVSDRELELGRERLFRAKLELQQVLDEYVDSRIRRWLGAKSSAGAIR